MRKYPWGWDPDKWVLYRFAGQWCLKGPGQSFWDRTDRFDTFQQALDELRLLDKLWKEVR